MTSDKLKIIFLTLARIDSVEQKGNYQDLIRKIRDKGNEIIIDCAEEMGVPCEGGIYLPPAEGECCSICIILGDIGGDGIINVLDVVSMVNLVLSDGYDEIADMNSDGVVNVLDVVILVGIILG